LYYQKFLVYFVNKNKRHSSLLIKQIKVIQVARATSRK
jgi:hypothetical protein